MGIRVVRSDFDQSVDGIHRFFRTFQYEKDNAQVIERAAMGRIDGQGAAVGFFGLLGLFRRLQDDA